MRNFDQYINESEDIKIGDYKGELNFDGEEKIIGGLADGMSLEDLAMRHSVDVSDIEEQFEKGVKVEMEHTEDEDIAGEIARDHIFEDPKYYDNLAKIEGGDDMEEDEEFFFDLDDEEIDESSDEELEDTKED